MNLYTSHIDKPSFFLCNISISYRYNEHKQDKDNHTNLCPHPKKIYHSSQPN